MVKATLDGKLMFPSEFVAAVEFQGKDVTLTIANVELADLMMADRSTQKKPILRFKETPKKLVLNKTNSGAIAELHGTEARKWIGKRVTLYPTTCMAFGKKADCIRVRERIVPSMTGKVRDVADVLEDDGQGATGPDEG